MVTCEPGISTERLDVLNDPPEGITHEQALWFRQLVLATIGGSGSRESESVSELDPNDDWGHEMDIRRFDD